MKITYEYVNGDIVEIDVGDNWKEVMVKLDRGEYNDNHRETRRHVHLDTEDDYGDWVTSEEEEEGVDVIIAGTVFHPGDIRIRKAINKLSDSQRDVIEHVYFQGISQREYGKLIGKAENTVSVNHKRALKNLKKFLIF